MDTLDLTTWLLLAIAILAVVQVVLLLRRPRGSDGLGSGLLALLREEFRTQRDETGRFGRDLREEVATLQGKANEALLATLRTRGDEQQNAMARLTETLDSRLETARQTLEARLHQGLDDIQKHVTAVIQALHDLERSTLAEREKAREALDRKFNDMLRSNEQKLDEMRQTVDEKLHGTLEKRLGESFRLVSERLEAVQKGLGEMQSLASGVGDLKRVLTNVKERGTWAEYQLGDILAQFLTPRQFERNVSPKNNGQVVEFAVKLPGRSGRVGEHVWLPIDAKFPKEDYQRLLDAAERGDAAAVQEATRALCQAVKKAAHDIAVKYLHPPVTTDFGILFLPTEGLYAEVLRQPGVHDEIQRQSRILIAGPTTLSALLNSLRVGFQTLAIEERAKEIWDVLGAIKTEFAKYGSVLDRLQKQLNTASKTVDETKRRARAMERRLRRVEELPQAQADDLLGLEALDDLTPDAHT